MTQPLIEVVFAHPKFSTKFPAEVSPDTTAQMACDELVKAKFIDAPTSGVQYVLVHQSSGSTIPASTTLAAAGVKSGDTVMVTEKTAGASHKGY